MTKAPIQYKSGVLPVYEIPLGYKTVLISSFLHRAISSTGMTFYVKRGPVC